MPASISQPLAFIPTPRLLEAAIAASDELGRDSGGAVEPPLRRAAFAAYARFGPERTAVPPRWRYDYAALPFEDLTWTTGRARLPQAPRPARAAGRPAEAADAPALAVRNAGGLVHLGSVYLEPANRAGDSRVALHALADAKRLFPARVARIAQRIVRPQADRFTALATAFQNCGAFVDVPAGAVVDAPLQLVWTARPGGASAVCSHTIVRVGAGARATIVERHLGESESFVSGIVEIELAAGARLDYVVVQQADEGARLAFRRGAYVGAGATLRWHLAELGAGLVRSLVDTRLAGAASAAETNAFFFARGFAHVDLALDVAHRGARSVSHTIVRSAATDRGLGRFRGAVRIPRAVRGCVTTLRDDALVLSRDAFIEARPLLEIDSAHVSAAQATTVGSLDEEQLFYVQSRGFARGGAERMLALAFFEPAIARFPSEALRDEVRTALDERLAEIPETFVQ